jgi:hypothetical protein
VAVYSSVDFLVCPVLLGIKFEVAGTGTTAQCVVGGEWGGGGLAARRENWIYIFACQEVTLQECLTCEQRPVSYSCVEQ